MNDLVNWFRRQISNPQIIILAVLLIFGFTFIIIAGKIVAPVIAALVIAYVLEGGVKTFQQMKMPRLVAVIVVVVLFLILVIALMFGLLPLVSAQAVQFAAQIPSWIVEGQEMLSELPQNIRRLSLKLKLTSCFRRLAEQLQK